MIGFYLAGACVILIPVLKALEVFYTWSEIGDN
jgi:hypothetical protein